MTVRLLFITEFSREESVYSAHQSQIKRNTQANQTTVRYKTAAPLQNPFNSMRGEISGSYGSKYDKASERLRSIVWQKFTNYRLDYISIVKDQNEILICWSLISAKYILSSQIVKLHRAPNLLSLQQFRSFPLNETALCDR